MVPVGGEVEEVNDCRDVQEAVAAPIAIATTPSAASIASPWRHFSLNTNAVMAALAQGMAAV